MKNILKSIVLLASIALLTVFNFGKTEVAGASSVSCSQACQAAHPNDSSAESQCESACSDQNDCSQLTGDAQTNCEKLDQQRQNALKLLQLSGKTSNLLNDQIDYINQQQTNTQQNLADVKGKISDLSSQITDLLGSISDNEKTITYQRTILTGLMQTYYDYDQQGLLKIMLLDQNLSSFNQVDYVEQSGSKVSDVLSTIQNTQAELNKEKQQLSDAYDQSTQLKGQLQDKQYSLQATENQKQALLTQTQGQEQQYENLLANIQAEKNQLFNFSSAGNLGDVFASLKDYPTPSNGNLASTSWYYSQRDSRWADQRIGNSDSLMGDYGCAVTSIAMVFTDLGSSINPGKMDKQKIFYYDLIEWPDSWSGGINLASSTSHGNINWSTVNSYIKKNIPVIVHINGGKGGHYVVITGKDSHDYIVHDPYFGPNLYLGTSMALMGKLLGSKTNIDQMIIYAN
ncbi:MAG: C39 family peptidase [Candidatus Pacebacteria bacterium]|nr:C39 family peptidase [Candidatus Paceibacterota bacterium]MDR3582808.1 C39 family peptidase [Candidatus Paceibacterota bacterium]